MKAQIIQIGNSQGIRIPKTLLEESGITGAVELEKHADGILIRNTKSPRDGWDEAFKTLGENDEAVERSPRTEFEQKEWQW